MKKRPMNPKEIEAILDRLSTLAYELGEFEEQINDIRILVENSAKHLREDLR